MAVEQKAAVTFKERFPALASRLGQTTPRGPSVADYKTVNGKSTDWDALVSRWLAGVDLEPNTVYAVTGFGNGIHIVALLDRLPEGSFVFCAEPQAEAVLPRADNELVESVLGDPRFYIGIGELDADFFESLSRFPSLEVTNAIPLVFALLHNLYPKYYSRFFSEFPKSLEYWRKLVGTNVTGSGLWQLNTLLNAPTLMNAPDLKSVAGNFQGCAAILVAAGPSLDGAIDFIRARADDCLIIAVNSSYRALRNAGIFPHFVIAADPYEYTGQGFEGVPCNDSILIAPFMVYPPVVEKFRGRILTWSLNNLLASYLRLTSGLDLGSEVAELGTVSGCVFDIAKTLGIRAIVFAGQDLAAGPDDRMHASDSFYSDLGGDQLKTQEYRLLPSNDGREVKVESKLYVYLKGMESLAKMHGREIDLYNLSLSGAKIEGIPYVDHETMTDILSEESRERISRGFKSAVASIRNAKDVSENLADSLHGLAEFARSVCSLSLGGAMELELALKSGSDKLETGIQLALEANRQLDALFKENPDPKKLLEDGALKYELALFREAVGQFDKSADIQAYRARELHERLWALAEGSFSFFKAIEESRKRLG